MTTLTATASLVHWYEQSRAAEALRESEASGKPLFVDFFAPQCKGCEKLEAVTYQDERVAALLNQEFIPVLYNGREQDENFERLNGKALYTFSPVLITRAADGTELHRTTGYLPPEDMLVELKLGLALRALHAEDWANAHRLLDSAVKDYPNAKIIPEALWWRGVAAFRKSNRNILDLAEAWAPLVREHPETVWADRADVLGPHCEC